MKKRKHLLKIFSLFFSVFIWLYATNSAEVERIKEIPITVEVPKGMILKNSDDFKVRYFVKGPNLIARKFGNEKILKKVEVKEYYKRKKKNYTVSLEDYRVKLPLGLELIKVTPSEINFQIDRLLKKKVPLIIEQDFKLVDGNVSIGQKFVTITGPRSILSKVKSWKLNKVDINELVEKKKVFASLESTDDNFSFDKDKIEVTYSPKIKNQEFTFNNVPIIFQTSKLLKSISQRVVSIKIIGDKDIVNNLDLDAISIFGTIPKKVKSQEIEVLLRAELPEGIELLEIKPEKVIVELEK